MPVRSPLASTPPYSTDPTIIAVENTIHQIYLTVEGAVVADVFGKLDSTFSAGFDRILNALALYATNSGDVASRTIQ